MAAARGATSSLANCSTVARYAICSGVSSRCMADRLRACAGQLLEERSKPGRCRAEILGQHAHVANDGHEVRVTAPARHQMHVDVMDDACAGRTAEVHADVDALRLIGLG